MKNYFLKFSQDVRINQLCLYLILVVAAVLRFWNYTAIPFTHDEFSALFRTKFADFAELIDKGIKVDGHPAGVQVFLFYLVKWVGFSEFWIKLPFVLVGIASIYLIYRIAKIWFTETAALLITAIFASIQYTVFQSQIARPYSTGLFFCLLLLWFLLQISTKNKIDLKLASGTVLSAAFCAYNHHFSMLLAAIIAISGLFLVDKSLLKNYLMLCVLSVILYLPHLPILFAQLKIGGIEAWLAKPNIGFITDYLF